MTVSRQAAALAQQPAPPGLLARGDWQYEAAYRAYVRMGLLPGWLALLLAAAGLLLYAWHVTAFP